METANEELQETGFRVQVLNLYYTMMEHRMDAQDLACRMERKPVISPGNYPLMTGAIDNHAREAENIFESLGAMALEEIIKNPAREQVMKDLEDILGTDYRKILKWVEARLRSELGNSGVDVEEFLAQQPEVIRDDVGAKATNFMAKYFECARRELRLQRREFVVPKMAEKVAELRGSS